MTFLAGQKVRASDLNAITFGNEQGGWTISANLAIGTPTLINNWTAFGGETITGISHSSGVFTVTTGGLYTIALSVRFSASTADRYCFITGATSGDTWAKDSVSSGATGLNSSCSVTKRIAAGGNIRAYAYSGAAANAVHETAGDLVTGITIYYAGP